MSAALYLADMSEFGDWLDQRLKEMPMSQAKLSALSGVSQGQLSRYRNEGTIPDPSTLKLLAPHLDADFDALMVLAGHSPGDTKKASGLFVVSTDDPKVHRLYKVVEQAKGASPEDIAKAEDILRTLFRK